MPSLTLAIFVLAMQAAQRPVPPPGSLRPTVTFGGSGQNTITAMTSDAAGNVYIAGSTSSPDFPVVNAAQPQFGESQLMSSANRGATWTKLALPPAQPLWIEPDPSVASILFAGTATGIYRSTDGGQTWASVYSWSVSAGEGSSMAIDPGNHLHMIATVATGLVILSEDGGNTWSTITLPSVYAFPGWPQFDPFGSGNVVLNGAIPYRSTDGGHTFTQFGPGGGGVQALNYDTVHQGWIWFAIDHGILGLFYRSTDGGVTWTQMPNPPAAVNWILVDPELPSTIYGGLLGGLFVSNDDAQTWSNMNLANGYSLSGRLAFLSRKCAGGGLYAITDGALQISQDFSTWRSSPFAGVVDVAVGAGCQVYAARSLSTDAFVAKLSPETRDPLWVTYLGGLAADAATVITVDGNGHVYVAGTSASLDFPSTVPRIGSVGTANVFLTEFNGAGQLVSSVIFGGDATDTPYGVAVDGAGNRYVVGWTDSPSFPLTPGALDTQLSNGAGGFAVKFAPNDSLSYATLLDTAAPYAVVIAGRNAVIGGGGAIPGQPPPGGKEPGFLLTLNATGSAVASMAYIGGDNSQLNYESPDLASYRWFGPFALASDAAGNIYVLGATNAADFPVTPAAYVSPLRASSCQTGPNFAPTIPPANVYVMKLAGIGQPPLYSAILGAQCAVIPGAIAVNTQGDATFTMATDQGLPLAHPLEVSPDCRGNSAAIAQLSADGSALEFSSYLATCGALPLAVLPSGASLVGAAQDSAALVVKVPVREGPVQIR
jgi:photosystem II stability/assembly factor-like uncharacterized protein